MKLPTIQEPILRDEIIITQAEQEKLITITTLRINRRKRDGLPLLIKQTSVLLPTIMEPEALELSLDVEIEPGAVLRGHDIRVELGLGRGDGALRAVVFIASGLEVRRRCDVEHVDVAVDRLRALLAVPAAAIACQH